MTQDSLFDLGSTTYSETNKPGSRLAEENHAELLRLYGQAPGHTCRDCQHLIRTAFLKCGKARQSRSGAADWRAGWPACGLHRLEIG